MRNLLAEAVDELHLAPGQTYRAKVNGVEVQMYRPVEPPAEQVTPPSPPDEEPSQFADMVMLQPWFDSPPPQRVITVKARIGPLPPPDPVVIPPDDEAAG